MHEIHTSSGLTHYLTKQDFVVYIVCAVTDIKKSSWRLLAFHEVINLDIII